MKRVGKMILLTLLVTSVSLGLVVGVSSVAPALSGKVTAWLHPTTAYPDQEFQYWDDLAAAFEKENPGTEVEIVWIPWEGGFQKKAVALQTGKVPDLTLSGAEQAITFAAMDGVLPVDDLIEQAGGPGVFLDGLKFHYWNGHYWGYPLFEGGYLFFYRKDILEAAGYAEGPLTWSELIEIGQKVNDPDNDLYAVGLDYSAGNSARQLYECVQATFDGRDLDADGKVAVDVTENYLTLKFYTDLFSKYKFVPPAATAVLAYMVTGTPLDDWYENGKIVMTIRSHSNADIWKTSKPELYEKTGVSVLPYGPSGHTGTFAQPGVLYIFSGTKNPELTKAFLGFYGRKDNHQAYGEFCRWPVRNDMDYSYKDADWFKFLMEELKYGVRTGTPTVHPKNGIAEESFWWAKMVQDVVINNMSVGAALKKWQKEVEKIYGEPASPLVTGG